MSQIIDLVTKRTIGKDEMLESFFSSKAKSTESKYRITLREWESWLVSIDKTVFTADSIDALRFMSQVRKSNGIRGLKIARTTVRNKCMHLHSIYEKCFCIYTPIRENPFDVALKESSCPSSSDRNPTKMIPFDDVKRLINSPSQFTKHGLRDRALLALLFGGALRAQESLDVKLRSIKVSQKSHMFLDLEVTKGGRRSEQPLLSWAEPAILAYKKIRESEGGEPNDYFIVRYYKDGNMACEHPRKEWLIRHFRTLLRNAGLSDSYSPHCARATAITRLLEQGISHRECMKFSRHKSVQMVEYYDKLIQTIENFAGRDIAY